MSTHRQLSSPVLSQVSVLDRLRALPSVFRGADLTVRFGWTSKNASQYLYLWGRRGLVSGLGGHSDVFFNLLTHPEPDLPAAVRMVMPTATIVGTEALRQAGWSTQIDQRPDLAVSNDQAQFTLSAFNVTPRSPKWFDTTRAGMAPAEGLGLSVLRPAWALADLLRKRDWEDFGLMPDDIDWSEVTDQDHQDWDHARLAFRLDAPDLNDLMVGGRDHATVPAPVA